MKTTNKHGLPAPMVEALQAETYDPGDCDYSISQLINPPQAIQLGLRHKDEIEEDVSDRVWSLLGTSVHYMIGLVADDKYMSEKRLFMNVDGCRISGQPDMFTTTGRLYDFKITSVWNYIYGSSIESWATQLNCYAALIRNSGLWPASRAWKTCHMERLQVIAILRDWSKTKASFDRSYPQAQVKTVDLNCWSDHNQDRYLMDRVQAHQDASQLPDELLPPCSDEDRWHSSNTWALMKHGAKRASKVFDTEESARSHAIEKGLSVGEGRGFYRIEFRQGEYRRCQDYCAGYQFCHQANHLVSLEL